MSGICFLKKKAVNELINKVIAFAEENNENCPCDKVRINTCPVTNTPCK